MGKENFDAYSAGRFESMNFTRNALTGKREEKDIRSQQLGTPKNAFKQVDTFTPAQLKAKEAITGLQHGQEWKAANQTQRINDFYEANGVGKTLRADYLMQIEPQIWAAIDKQLGKEGKQQLLSAIEVKAARVEKTETSQKAVTQAEQNAAAQQLKVEAIRLAQLAPAEIVAGGLAFLTLWVINRLPDKKLRFLGTTIFLSLVLAACSVVSAAAPTQEAPSVNNNPIPTEVAKLPNSDTQPTTEIRITQEATPQPEATSVTTDQLNELNTDINSEIAKAVESADPTAKMSYETMDRSQSIGMIFANSLTSPEDPKDRILDSSAFSAIILPSGQACLILEVDSVWGGAKEVAVIDTGEKSPMFVTLEGGLSAALGISDNEMARSKKDYELVLGDFSNDSDTKTNYFYAAIRQKSTGKIIAVVDAKKQWTANLETAVALQPMLNTSQIVTSYLNGEIDNVSNLSDEELAKFSAELAEKKNAERGINPIIYNNEAFIDPNNLRMRDYDGHADLEETMEMYLAIKGKDSDGNLQIIDQDGKIVTIDNSANIDWSLRITDPQDTRITWPNTKKINGITEAQWYLDPNSNNDNLATIIPVVYINKELGNLYFDGTNGKSGRMVSSLQFLTIETDVTGKAILAKTFLIMPGPTLDIFEEGASIKKGNGGFSIEENSSFWTLLEEKSVYYLIAQKNQDKIYNENVSGSAKKYEGLLWGDEAYSVFDVKPRINQDVALVAARALIKHK